MAFDFPPTSGDGIRPTAGLSFTALARHCPGFAIWLRPILANVIAAALVVLSRGRLCGFSVVAAALRLVAISGLAGCDFAFLRRALLQAFWWAAIFLRTIRLSTDQR